MKFPVDNDRKERRGRSNRWSLYSVGPSWGSASSFVMPQSVKWQSSVEQASSEAGSVVAPPLFRVAARRGVEDPEVDHGDETLGGSGSYVKTEAITCSEIFSFSKQLLAFQIRTLAAHIYKYIFGKRPSISPVTYGSVIVKVERNNVNALNTECLCENDL